MTNGAPQPYLKKLSVVAAQGRESKLGNGTLEAMCPCKEWKRLEY